MVVLVALMTMVSPVLSVSPTQASTAPTVSLSGPSLVESGRSFTLGGSASPVRAGRMVVVQRRLGTSWIEVGRMAQSATGRYSVVTRVSSVGTFAYRAVAVSWNAEAAVTSRLWGVTSHAPYLLLTPSTAIASETVAVTGRLPGVSSRPVWVQRRSGTSWVTLVKATTSSSGTYATSFKAPLTGSYVVRALAPQVTTAGSVRPQYLSDSKTLGVVAQSASLTLPTTLVEGATGAATLAFGPARAGRGVAFQVLRSGVWTAVSTAQQSSTGTALLVVIAGTPGSYSYRAWAPASAGAAAFASATHSLTVTAASVEQGAISGSVTDAAGSLSGVSRFAVTVTSASTGGTAQAIAFADGSYTTGGIPPATDYRVCFEAFGASKFVKECYENQPTSGTSTPVAVASGATTTGIDAALTAWGMISGTVTDAGGTHQGLANVDVMISSPSTGVFGGATTAADGTYTATNMASATDYQVCYFVNGVTGGPADAAGYVDHCYNNQRLAGTPTPVTVTDGVTTSGIDAALVRGGAASGTVTETGGSMPVAGVLVEVSSTSTGHHKSGFTAADGSYTVTGLVAGTDYHVCFNASASYVDQCYDDQPTGSPTSVTLTGGVVTSGLNAALVGSP
jgi:hypothetical protein